MQVLAALGDAPTAAIAVLAILLGVFLAARGPRGERAASPDPDPGQPEQSGRSLFRVPVAAAPEPEPEADVEPGFVGPEGEVVGHGPIRLGVSGPLGGGEPAEVHPAAAPVQPAPEAAPEPEAEAEPEPEPAPAPAPEPQPPAAVAPPAPGAEPAGAEARPAASEQALFTAPPTLPDPPAAGQDDAGPEPAPDPPPDADADAAEEPGWRVAGPAENTGVRFRQGTIKLGGKPVNEPNDQD